MGTVDVLTCMSVCVCNIEYYTYGGGGRGGRFIQMSKWSFVRVRALAARAYAFSICRQVD